MQEQKVYSVFEINQVVKRAIDSALPYSWVKGEITNLTRASSGHIYFSLKDERAVLPCVWFKNAQKDQTFDPLTGEVFDTPLASLAHSLEQGMEMLFAGSFDVYAPRGAYQFIIDQAEEVGQGSLHRAFEVMKKKLDSLGFFDDSHKKILPVNPKKVAVLTSPQGAVIHDFCKILNEYGLGSSIHLYPIAVQGHEAVPSIIKAINKVHEDNWAEVIVLMRGGGSLEDLWAFNEEEVARVIFEAKIPIISAIGHQTDYTIADFVADKRAATPSHAVACLWQERDAYRQEIDDLEALIKRKMLDILRNKNQQLNTISQSLKIHSPQHKLNLQAEKLKQVKEKLLLYPIKIEEKAKNLSSTTNKLKPLFSSIISSKKIEIQHAYNLLEAHNPYKPLEKGYALVHKMQAENIGNLITSIDEIENSSHYCIEFKDGKVALQANNIQKL